MTLKLLCYQKGITLGELARKSGIAHGTLYAISAGNRTLSEQNREKIAKVLGIPAGDVPPITTLSPSRPGADRAASPRSTR